MLGLTASFNLGQMKNLAKKRRQLEELMQAQIFVPTIDEAVDFRENVF
jgi:hypothetical protein